MNLNGTEGGNKANLTSEYKVVSVSATTFVVNLTAGFGGSVAHYIFWVWKNGTASAEYYDGQYEAGAFAELAYFQGMILFSFETELTSPQTLSQIIGLGEVHVVSSGQVMIGPTSVNVTTYAPNKLPVVFSTCTESGDFTRFSVQFGTVAGESQGLLTSLNLVGTGTISGAHGALDFLLQVTSITKAT